MCACDELSRAAQLKNTLAGCSKSSSSKAAGESNPEAYPQGYVEDFDEPRTTLASFFSILPLDIWNLPVDWSYPRIGKIPVDVRKAPASEKLSDRQGRGVGARNHGMVRLRNQLPFLLGFTSPQHKDHRRLLRCNQFDHAIGELLPAASLMRIGLVRPDREDRVEHKDALSGPGFQIPVIRDRAPKIFMEFPIDVSQRLGQRPNGWLHRKTETMSMTRGWIWILANQQHTDLVI